MLPEQFGGPLPPAMEGMFDGAKVRAKREALGLNRTQLAEMVCVKPCTISKVEGKGKRLSLALARRLSWALRTPMDDLF